MKVFLGLSIFSLVIFFSFSSFAAYVTNDFFYRYNTGCFTIDGDDVFRYLPVSEKLDILLRDIAEYYRNEGEPAPNFVVFTKDPKDNRRISHHQTYTMHFNKKKRRYEKTDYFIPGQEYLILHDPERLYAVGEFNNSDGSKVVHRYHKVRAGFNGFFPSTTSPDGIGKREVAHDTTYIERKEIDPVGRERITRQVLNIPIFLVPKSVKVDNKKEPITSFRIAFKTERANADLPGLGTISVYDKDPTTNSYCIRAKGYTWEESCGSLVTTQWK